MWLWTMVCVYYVYSVCGPVKRIFYQCWFNVGRASAKLARHQIFIYLYLFDFPVENMKKWCNIIVIHQRKSSKHVAGTGREACQT